LPRAEKLIIVPFLYNFSPSVVHPPLDWTEWIHVTGYWFLENADESAKKSKWTPPDGLLDFIDTAHVKGKKVVYMYVFPLLLVMTTNKTVGLDRSSSLTQRR
jgi:hypothetical protein